MAGRWLLPAVLWLSACSAPVAASIPPDFSLLPEDELGIINAPAIKSEFYPNLKSKFGLKSNPISTFGLGGLTPALNMLLVDEESCLINNTDKQSDMVLSADHSKGESVCRTYLAEIGNDLVHMKTKAEFKAHFAPVESREEALSFLFALEPEFIGSLFSLLYMRVAKEGDGFLVVTLKSPVLTEKCLLLSETLTKVSRDGELTRISQRQFRASKQLEDCKIQPQPLTQ